MSTWTFSQQFLSDFQASRSDLASRLGSFKSASAPADVIQALSLELSKLTKSLIDATGSLPSYDQRQCELQLKALEKTLDELRTNSTPKLKFSFKRKEKPAESSLQSSITVVDNALATTVPMTTNLALSSRSRSYLTLRSLPDSVFKAHLFDLTISDLDGCIVNLLPHLSKQPSLLTNNLDISALHVRKISNTILLLPEINGSILLHDLSRCVVVVGCHQFRMHTSKNVDVYISIASNPTIEHSSDIRFAAYPSVLSTRQFTEPDKPFAVQDFSHIRSSPSPNWSTIPEDAHITEWPLLEVSDEDLLTAVQRLLPGNTAHGHTAETTHP